MELYVSSPIITSNITIAGTEDERRAILSYMQMLTNHGLHLNNDNRLVVALVNQRIVQNRGETWLGYGNALIERMARSEHSLTISATTGPSQSGRYDGNYGHAYVPGKGVSSRIVLNLNSDIWTYTVNDRVVSQTTIPIHIILAHELIYADRAMRGEVISFDQSNGLWTKLPPQ